MAQADYHTCDNVACDNVIDDSELYSWYQVYHACEAYEFCSLSCLLAVLGTEVGLRSFSHE